MRSTRNRRIVVGAAVVGLLVLMAFYSASRNEIPDGEWQLISTNFEDEIDLRPLRLTTDDGRLSGDDGCNTFFEEPDGLITTTIMGCPEEPHNLGYRVSQSVRGSRTMDGDHLVLTGGGFRLEYERVD